jgi:hypothetical protein
MGTGDAPTITCVGNWKCPFCARFSTGNATRAGLTVWALDPASDWACHETARRASPRVRGVGDRLAGVAAGAGVGRMGKRETALRTLPVPADPAVSPGGGARRRRGVGSVPCDAVQYRIAGHSVPDLSLIAIQSINQERRITRIIKKK